MLTIKYLLFLYYHLNNFKNSISKYATSLEFQLKTITSIYVPSLFTCLHHRSEKSRVGRFFVNQHFWQINFNYIILKFFYLKNDESQVGLIQLITYVACFQTKLKCVHLNVIFSWNQPIGFTRTLGDGFLVVVVVVVLVIVMAMVLLLRC